MTTFLISVLAAAGALGLLGFQSVTTSSQYNQCRQIAIDLAANPNSHSQAQADSCGDGLLNVMKSTLGPSEPCTTVCNFAETGAFDATGVGVRQLVASVESQEDLRAQPVVIQFFVDPPRPLANMDVRVTVMVLNPATNSPVPAGTRVAFNFVTSDNSLSASGVVFTDANGTVEFDVEGSRFVGVRDTFTLTVGSVTQSFSYTYH